MTNVTCPKPPTRDTKRANFRGAFSLQLIQDSHYCPPASFVMLHSAGVYRKSQSELEAAQLEHTPGAIVRL